MKQSSTHHNGLYEVLELDLDKLGIVGNKEEVDLVADRTLTQRSQCHKGARFGFTITITPSRTPPNNH